MKKLTAIEDLPPEEAEAVSSAVTMADEAKEEAPRQAPTSIPGGVRRIRSHHHRHRRFRMEKLEEIRHREDVRALAFILPLILLVIGLGIFGVAFRNNDPSLRPEKMLSLAWCLMTIGGGWLFLSTGLNSWQSWKEAKLRDAEEKAAGGDSSSSGRRRRRHHHHSSSSSSGEHHHHVHHAYEESIARAQAAATAAAASAAGAAEPSSKPANAQVATSTQTR